MGIGSRHRFDRISLGRPVGAHIQRHVNVEAHKIQRASDGLHIAGFSFWRIRAFLFQIALRILALHDRRQERRVSIARSLAGGLNVLRRFHHRHIDHRVLRHSHLGSAGRIGANRLYCEPVGENAMVAYLVHGAGSAA